MRPWNLLDLLRLQCSQWQSPATIERIQTRKLRKIVGHAATRVPFYRAMFADLKIDARDIRRAADLAALPVVSKQDLQRVAMRERIAGNVSARACHSQMTSGSTGEPLEVLFRRRDETILNLGWVRAFLAAGLRPWEKRLVFTPKRVVSPKRSWYEYLGLMRRLDVSTWSLPAEWVSTVQRWSPEAIMGYVKVMQLFAETIEQAGAEGIAPRLVFTTSEILDDATRSYLVATFGGRVVNIYASAEAGCMAWECQQCGAMHVASDTVVLEILKDGRPAKPGEEGEVVVTNLHSYAMPFLRYRQGDRATLSDAPRLCGRGLPLLDGVQGRVDDCIVLRSGRTISYSPFYYSVQFAPGVRRWKVVQEDLDTLRVHLEAGPLFDEAARAQIIRDLRAVVGPEMTISLDLVDSLAVDPRSKFRAVSSNVPRR